MQPAKSEAEVGSGPSPSAGSHTRTFDARSRSEGSPGARHKRNAATLERLRRRSSAPADWFRLDRIVTTRTNVEDPPLAPRGRRPLRRRSCDALSLAAEGQISRTTSSELGSRGVTVWGPLPGSDRFVSTCQGVRTIRSGRYCRVGAESGRRGLPPNTARPERRRHLGVAWAVHSFSMRGLVL